MNTNSYFNWMTISELADYLHCSKEYIYKMAQKNALPASKLGRHWRFRQDLIDQWLSSNSESPFKPAKNKYESESS